MRAEESKPRALLIHHSGLVGGAGRSLLDVARSIGGSYDVTIYVPSRPSDLASELSGGGFRLKTFSHRMAKIPYYSGGERLWHPRFWYYVAQIPFQMRFWEAVVARERPDVVLVNSGVLSWLGLVLGGLPSVLFVRETMRGSRVNLINCGMRWLRAKFSAVVYLTEYDRDADDLRMTSTRVVPDAVCPSDYRDVEGRLAACRGLGISASGINVLYLGGANRLKGLDVAVSAIARTRDSGIRLVAAGTAPVGPTGMRAWISGRGRFHRKVIRTIERHGLSDRVHFVGVSSDVRRLLSACDWVVFPMAEPHQARPAFEAGFQQKPIVISDFANIRGCVVDGVNGIAFTPGDPQDLARSFDELASDPELRRALGAANADHARSSHDRSVVAGLVLHLLRDVRGVVGSGRT